MKCQDTYKEVRTFTYPNCIIRVHIPDITEEERARRMQRIHDAAAELIMDARKRKGECANG